jgi:hypothetical protein
LNKPAPKPLLRIQLGEHHDAFMRWCRNSGRDPTGVVQQLVGMALDDLVTPPSKSMSGSAKNAPRLRVNLGDSHVPFVKWCATRNVAAASIVRQWLIEIMAKGDISGDRVAKARPREVVGASDPSRVRVVLRMSQSELDAWESLALERKETPPKLMLRMLRSCLTKSIGFSPEEASMLGTHNLLLLRACNAMNRLAKHADGYVSKGEVVSLDAESLQQEVAAVRNHMERVSSLLSSHRERWLIEIDREGLKT